MTGRDLGDKSRKLGMLVMVIIALVGNLPMILGTDILKATTISGTMVIGLAPVFLLHGLVRPTKIGFHLSFWIGIILGFAMTFNAIPAWFAIGTGKYAMLLGVNLYGLIACTLAYIVAGLVFGEKTS